MSIINPTEEELSAWLAMQPGRGNSRLSDLALSPQEQQALMADLQQTQDPENAAIMQQMQPRQSRGNTLSALAQPQQMNTAVSSSGRTIDLGYAAPGGGGVSPDGFRVKPDPWVEGPRELSRNRLRDGTIEVIREYPALDGFGRQSSKLVREIETPAHLNPNELKRVDYQTKVAAMTKAQREAQGGNAEPKFHEGQWVYPPSQANPSGQAVPVGGFKKAPTEDQGKTAYNVGRILQSAKMVQDAVEKNPSAIAPGTAEAVAGVTPLWGSAQSGLQNLARGKDRQIVNQSQADIIDSLLFLATGAAYNKEQLEQQRASYLPNWTDKPEAVNAKNERMKGLIESAKVRAGTAWTPDMDAALNVLSIPKMDTGKQQGAPKMGTVVKGYIYLGGDPASQSSWKKAQ